MSTNPATNLVPAIGSAVVPTIPADTKGSPDTQKSTAPVDVGPNVPESSTQESEDGELKEGGAVVKPGKGSMPQNLADNIPSADGEPQLTPPRPPFAPVMSNLSTQAQAGSIYSSASTATLNSDNISTMVHTGGTHSPHPVRPLGESKVFDSPDSPAASATASLRTISLNEGVPAPQNPRADEEFASKVADTLLAADTAASLPAPVSAFSSLGSAALNSYRPEDNFPSDTPQSFIDAHSLSLYPSPPFSGATGTGSGDFAIQASLGDVDKTASPASNPSQAEDTVPAPNLQSFIDATANPSFSSSDASLATGAHGAGALPTMPLEVLKQERVEDNPLGDTPAETTSHTSGVMGSASLISSNPNDKFPADTRTSSLSTATTPTTPPTAPHSNNLNADEVAVQEDGAPESGGEDDEGGHKKPKLMQRLKEKMHIGHGHS
ncbi:hypothetical protein C8R47DRAFT_1086985 [Mycena vitilis]|nr:hypothetical protein C8R47DRAFT_1086985 [Mycena vitilis]